MQKDTDILIACLYKDHDILISVYASHGHPIRVFISSSGQREYLFNDWYRITVNN